MDNLTLSDAYFGRKRERLTGGEMIKRETLRMWRAYKLGKGGLKKHLLFGKSTP